jgi:hypothetical protein
MEEESKGEKKRQKGGLYGTTSCGIDSPLAYNGWCYSHPCDESGMDGDRNMIVKVNRRTGM